MTTENTGVADLRLAPPRRPPKGHRAQRYRYTTKMARSRLAVELRRSTWPEFWRALSGSEGLST